MDQARKGWELHAFPQRENRSRHAPSSENTRANREQNYPTKGLRMHTSCDGLVACSQAFSLE
jgi:hypothetical protein